MGCPMTAQGSQLAGCATNMLRPATQHLLWSLPMQRVTITLDEALLGEVDRFMVARGYQNRSEAIRDLARAGLQETEAGTPADGKCVAAAIYVYDHDARELPKRLNQTFHDHHDLSLSTLHVHLDHESCMEIAVLKGATEDVRHFAEHVIAERNVRYGRVVMVPLEETGPKHRHDHGTHIHTHVHPRT
jgi:CopG family transcriptional regulator, nickel-responsive regulator